MTSPVDDLGEHVAGGECRADHEPWADAALALGLRRLRALDLRAGGRVARTAGRLVGGRVAGRARLDQARLQLAEELRVLGERLADLRFHAAGSLCLLDERIELVGRALDGLVALRHFLVGGASPVVTCQIFDASRRAAIVEAAPSPA